MTKQINYKTIESKMWKVLPLIFFFLFLGGLFIGLILLQTSLDKKEIAVKGYACSLVKWRMINPLIEESIELQDKKILCHDNNCLQYFDDRLVEIKSKLDFIISYNCLKWQ